MSTETGVFCVIYRYDVGKKIHSSLNVSMSASSKRRACRRTASAMVESFELVEDFIWLTHVMNWTLNCAYRIGRHNSVADVGGARFTGNGDGTPRNIFVRKAGT